MGWIRSTLKRCEPAGGGRVRRVPSASLHLTAWAQRPGERSLGASPRSSSPARPTRNSEEARPGRRGSSLDVHKEKRPSYASLNRKRPTSSAWAVITTILAITSSLGLAETGRRGCLAGSRAPQKERGMVQFEHAQRRRNCQKGGKGALGLSRKGQRGQPRAAGYRGETDLP